jgi:putative PIN family toxin of toxin-antitoxin system
MRVVLDTDVIVAALRSPRGASAVILRCLDEGRGTMLLSVPLALEYEAVCQLAEHRLVTGLTTDDVEVFVNSLVALAEPVEAHFRWRPTLHDPADEMVLETAVNGNADALVTFNQRHFKPVPAQFGIKILLPREALRRLRL